MKSIVQEASSVEKAIQRAWEEAGFPSEFSVRVLEHPKHSFFFFLRRSAKVALVFPSESSKKQSNERNRDYKKRETRPKKEDRTEQTKNENKKTPRKERQEDVRRPQKNNSATKKPKEPVEVAPETSELSRALSTEKKTTKKQVETPIAPAKETQEPAKQKIEQRPLQQQVWDEELVAKIKTHLSELLNLMNRSNCSYAAEVKGRELIILFSGFVLENKEQDRRLFSGLSPLLMTMTKREFKKALRGYRIVLGHAE